MPIYEYKCNNCGTLFEKLQKFNDPPMTECENCQSADVARVMSPPAFHLKGGGWYKDGYAGSGTNGKSEKSETSGEKKSSDSSSSNQASESKPASKSESTTAPAKPAATSDKK